MTPDKDSNNNDCSSISFETIDDDRDKDFNLDDFSETSSSSASFIGTDDIDASHCSIIGNEGKIRNITISNRKEQILSFKDNTEKSRVIYYI